MARELHAEVLHVQIGRQLRRTAHRKIEQRGRKAAFERRCGIRNRNPLQRIVAYRDGRALGPAGVAPLGDPQHAVAYLGAEPGRIGALRIVDDPRSLRIGNLHEADIDRRGDLDGRERRQPLAALPSGRVGSRRDRRGNGSSRHRPAHRIGGGKPRCTGRDTDGNPCQKGRQNQSLHLFFHGPKS